MRSINMFCAALLLGVVSMAPAPAVAGPAAEVNANTFYTNARALEKKGLLARLDSRYKPTFAQMKDAGTQARAANEAAKKRGKPLYCVPSAARKKGLNVEGVLNMLGALGTETRRKLNLETAWLKALQKKYPC